MNLRPYQSDAIAAIESVMQHRRGENPAVVIPTGGGKSIIMGSMIHRYVTTWPGTRILVVAHVQELVWQNADKLARLWPEAPMGIYSAGLNQRDTQSDIIFASIQSIANRAEELGRFDLIFIDEAHRIPVSGDGQYLQFIAAARAVNPSIAIVGFTATPYRLGSGLVTGPGHILNFVAYDIPVRRLIDDGYLSGLITKGGKAQVDRSNLHVRGGEYIAKEVDAAVTANGLVASAVTEALAHASGRRSILWFAASVDHAELISADLERHGESCAVLTGKTPKPEREQIICNFQAGKIRSLVNVNVLSEGFDAPGVDCIVMLRPTKSAGLYYQQVGRGLRLAPGKADCLVLDFAGNVAEHGPIDTIRVRENRKKGESATVGAPTRTCPECQTIIEIAIRSCPGCGYDFPKAKLKHSAVAHTENILSQPPKLTAVTDVEYRSHIGQSGIPTLLAMYRCGMSTFREWICIEHDGYAGAKAASWWRDVTGQSTMPATVFDALSWLAENEHEKPSGILIDSAGKWPKIVSKQWKKEAKANDRR